MIAGYPCDGIFERCAGRSLSNDPSALRNLRSSATRAQEVRAELHCTTKH